MSSTELFLIAAAFSAGFVIAWLLASAQVRSKLSQEIGKHLSAIAGHISTSNELRQQVQSQKNHLDKLQAEYQQEASARATAEAKFQAEHANLAEQRRLLDDAQSKLSDAFKALASGVMEQSNKQFLELAKTSFETLQTKASGDLTQRQQAIESLVAPLGISLNSMLQEVGRLEESRQKAYGELTTQVGQLAKSSEDLREETGTLVTSLRQPQIKGKWGEITLRRAVELAGMSPHCTFVEQASLDSDEGRLRPDLTVQITGNRRIIVDAKVPLHAYMKGASAQTAEEYRDAMAAHAQLVRNHVSELSRRDYSSYLERSIGHAVCYLPAESFFSAALEQDHSLIEYAKDKNVLLASPTILIALLCAIATGWKEEQVAENAARISENAKELYERFTTFAQHLEDIYAGLERANKAFNAAVGSYEQRLLPGARKFKDLGIQSTAEAPELEPTQTSLRAFTATSSDKP